MSTVSFYKLLMFIRNTYTNRLFSLCSFLIELVRLSQDQHSLLTFFEKETVVPKWTVEEYESLDVHPLLHALSLIREKRRRSPGIVFKLLAYDLRLELEYAPLETFEISSTDNGYAIKLYNLCYREYEGVVDGSPTYSYSEEVSLLELPIFKHFDL